MKTSISRRQFLVRALETGAAATACNLCLFPLRGADAPSNKIAIGCIGVGEHGTNRNLRMLLPQPDARVRAVCDVFRDRVEDAQGLVNHTYQDSDCRATGDFREILAAKDIDAVMISTPDHWHVTMSVMAMRAGKDVICEKPTLTIAEGKLLVETVRRHKAVFQTSTEDRSMECYHRMAELVRNGMIGDVERVEVELPSGNRYPHENPCPVPDGFDYDMWLGPAPEAPFTANRTERMHWRQQWDYSGGLLTDWGMHQLDTVQLALGKERTGPVKVEGKGSVHEGSMFNAFIDYEVVYTYADGLRVQVKSGGTSLRFFGSKGSAGNASWAQPLEASRPELLTWAPGADDIHLPTHPGAEHRSFLDAVHARTDPYFPAEDGHRCATLCHLGNIAMLLGRPLAWDPEKERFIDDDEAQKNMMYQRQARAPWTI